MNFLEELFAHCEQGYCTITKLGRSAGQAPELVHLGVNELDCVDQIIQEFPDSPLYFNVGIKNDKPSDRVRGDKSTISQVTCLWADIDFPKAGSKKNYPTQQHVLEALAAMPVRYSSLVETGGGVHAYWFLSEPHQFDGTIQCAEEFEARYSRRWEALILKRLQQIDKRYQIDTVTDVTRMMRLPGSTHQSGRLVKIAEHTGIRYHLEDLASYLDGITPDIEPYHPAYAASLPAGLTGDLNEKKLHALLTNCQEFKRVWEKKKMFPSPSEYDASIASFAAAALWSDTEIANLVIRFNRTHTPDRLEKVLRVTSGKYDYLDRLLILVRGDQARYEAARQLSGSMSASDGDIIRAPAETRDGETVPAAINDAIPGEARDRSPELSREEIAERLSVLLNIPVDRWIQVGRECPLYTLILKGGQQIKIGGEQSVLHGQRQFATRVYSETRMVMPTHTNAEWSSICIGLGKIVEVIDAPEATTSDVIVSVMRSYLEKMRWRSGKDVDVGVQAGAVVHRDGKFYVQIGPVAQYASKFMSMKWSSAEYVNAFRAAGFERETIHYRATTGKRSTRSAWSCSEDVFSELLPQEVSNVSDS